MIFFLRSVWSGYDPLLNMHLKETEDDGKTSEQSFTMVRGTIKSYQDMQGFATGL